MNNKVSNTLHMGLLGTAVVFAVGGLIGVSDRERAEEAVKDMGFTQVSHVGKASIWNCGRDGFFRDSFTAVNGQGRKVELVVCRSPLSSSSAVRVMKHA